MAPSDTSSASSADTSPNGPTSTPAVAATFFLSSSFSSRLFISLFFFLILPSLLLLLYSPSAAASHVVSRARFLSSSSSSATPPPQPYRTGFHFQPPKNWMNDPNGLMYYKGHYHLFYQWNPYAAVWGNITWGHAVSTDMLHWKILELALVPSEWYDLYGCWSGSATFLTDGRPVLVYTGWSNASAAIDDQVQVQAMAVPADPSDSLLRRWKKISQNPLLQAPWGINSTKFRDPTTGWRGEDGRWRMVVGARRNHRGVALLYRSHDFIHWELAKHPLHSVPFTGMWECPDFYPVDAAGTGGLDQSVNGLGVLHVLKVSLDDTKHDYYAVGRYIESTDSFVPVNNVLDTGIGLRYDYGKFYASKTFYDSDKRRRILFGWVNESSTTDSDVAKGWSSVQGFPRMVWLDEETKQSLRQWPVPEVETLRKAHPALLADVHLDGGAVVEMDAARGAQLDIEVEFEMPEHLLNNRTQAVMNGVTDTDNDNGQLTCSRVGTSSGGDGILGPFGLLVLASDDRQEQTAVFFYVQSTGGNWKALVCSDQSRSTLIEGPDKTSYGTHFTISKKRSTFQLRILVDHSIVETFAQGGKVCITSRVYPTKAIDGDAHLYVFNNGSKPIRVNRLVAWEMSKVKIESTP